MVRRLLHVGYDFDPAVLRELLAPLLSEEERARIVYKCYTAVKFYRDAKADAHDVHAVNAELHAWYQKRKARTFTAHVRGLYATPRTRKDLVAVVSVDGALLYLTLDTTPTQSLVGLKHQASQGLLGDMAEPAARIDLPCVAYECWADDDAAAA